MGEQEAEEHLQKQSPQALLQQHGERRPRSAVELPWWRSPLAGYLICPFLVGMALLIALLDLLFGLEPYLTGAPFFLATVVVAWLWGGGPALLAILLGIVALATFIIPPHGLSTFTGWGDVWTYLPFVAGELLVALITVQRERAQQRALIAKREERARAQELAQVNQALVHSNEQLERANQLKDIFLSRASHELKTPVTTIRGQAQFALRRLGRSQQTASEQLSVHTHLEKIDTQTHRLHALIDDLLEVSSLSSGKIPLRFTLCDLGRLCCEVIEDQRALSGRGIELELPSEPVMLQADCQRLIQVIINLVSNAVKYSPENTAVLVAVSQGSSYVLLTVHNDGSALSREQQLQIFEPFYRAPEAQRSPAQGWGLGLSISKEIVERHAGLIGVESSEGKGTTFFVQLPVQAPT